MVGTTAASFFPKADAAVLRTKYETPSQTSRPSEVGPVLDPKWADEALDSWSAQVARDVYPEPDDIFDPAPIPDNSLATICIADRYLFPILTRNERLRLTMLFYYTRDAVHDTELMSRLQEKVYLAQETVNWEFAIAGLLSHNTYTRLVTAGLPLAVLPRRESTCAHTVNQPPGTIFNLTNMAEDWRFKKSPHVELGGLRSYAGVPLRFETEYGQHVALGSLCVASNSEQPPLSKAQQMSLGRLADWIVADIVHSARSRRQRERRRMMELLSATQKQIEATDDFETIICDMLREVYPSASVGVYTSTNGQLLLEGGTAVSTNQIEHGLWEDGEYFDYFLERFNHLDLVAPRVVRVIAAECADQRIPTYLAVGSKDFRTIFDDVDSSFVQMAAQMLCRGRQSLALREALNAKEDFLRGITHQLRTPIHGILGSVELLAEELEARKADTTSTDTGRGVAIATSLCEHKDPTTYIKTIRSSARELISTVNSLINLNHWADIAQAERIFQPHHVNDVETALLEEIWKITVDQLFARPSIMIKTHFPQDVDTLVVDMRLFVDCVLPLIVNAVQATVGGIVCVTLRTTDDYQSLIVDVEDNGRGISVSDQEDIFKAYTKVDSHTTGAGLGLTLASRLATIMNGKVELVRSDVEKGSHFRATFAQPVLAGSIALPDQEKGSAGYRRLTFDTSGSTESVSLSNFYAQYLVHRGHIRSLRSDSSVTVFDYPACSEHSKAEVLTAPGKVGICLIPDSVPHSRTNDGQQIRREGNIVYVKGPFQSNTLDEALRQAYDIMYAADVPTNVTNIKPVAEEVIDASVQMTVADHPPRAQAPPSYTSSDTLSRLDTIENTNGLTASMRTLQVKASAPPLIKSSGRPTTLIVDDNAVNLRFLEMYCRHRRIPHLTATDGLQAVNTFSDRQGAAFAHSRCDVNAPISLILMDLQMPNCDGIEATRRIRELESKNGWSKSTIVIVTGQDSLQDRLNSKEAGADGYFVKPVGPKTLDSGIKEWFPEANT